MFVLQSRASPRYIPWYKWLPGNPEGTDEMGGRGGRGERGLGVGVGLSPNE